MYAFVRASTVKTRQALGAMQKHARGVDATAKSRRRADAAYRSLAIDFKEKRIRKLGVGEREVANITDAYEQHLAAHSATPRKGAAICLHFIVGVSDEWVRDTGDLHDPNNERNQLLLHTAVRWAEEKLGGCFAARLDLDERGGAVVDLFAAPIHHNKRSGKASVSVNQALKRMAREYGKPAYTAFSVAQDSWTDYINRALGTDFVRGDSKKKTRRKNMRPEEYGKMKEEQDQIVADREAVEREKIALKEREDDLKKREDSLADDRAELLSEVQKNNDFFDKEKEELADREKEAAELNERAQAQKRENDEIVRELEAREDVVKKSIRSWRKYSKKSTPWLKRPNNPTRLRDQGNEGPGFSFSLFDIAKMVWQFLKFVGSMIVGDPHRILESVEYDNLVLVNEGLTAKVNEIRSTAQAPKMADLPEKRRKRLQQPKNDRTNRPLTRPKSVQRPNVPQEIPAQETPVLSPENALATEITNREHEPWFSVIEEDFGDLATSYRESKHYPPRGTMDDVDRAWREWLKETAHQSLRGADQKTRDLVAKARTAAKDLGIYKTRRERDSRGTGIDL